MAGLSMYFVYVLYSQEDDKFYTGYTKDLKRRLNEHRIGEVYTTARYQGVNLIFYEGFVSQADALRRERYFKTTKGKKALRFILRESLKSKKRCLVV